jgi:hypothetical protein
MVIHLRHQLRKAYAAAAKAVEFLLPLAVTLEIVVY